MKARLPAIALTAILALATVTACDNTSDDCEATATVTQVLAEPTPKAKTTKKTTKPKTKKTKHTTLDHDDDCDED